MGTAICQRHSLVSWELGHGRAEGESGQHRPLYGPHPEHAGLTSGDSTSSAHPFNGHVCASRCRCTWKGFPVARSSNVAARSRSHHSGAALIARKAGVVFRMKRGNPGRKAQGKIRRGNPSSAHDAIFLPSLLENGATITVSGGHDWGYDYQAIGDLEIVTWSLAPTTKSCGAVLQQAEVRCSRVVLAAARCTARRGA